MAQPQTPKTLEQVSQELQTMFEEMLGSRNVYYNPPADIRMKYDAIVFRRSQINNIFANNIVYGQSHRYEITVITRDPDAEIIQKISRLPRCGFDRSFVSDNLYHNVFTINH